MYMYVCICAYVYICVYMHVCVYIYGCMYMCIWLSNKCTGVSPSAGVGRVAHWGKVLFLFFSSFLRV